MQGYESSEAQFELAGAGCGREGTSIQAGRNKFLLRERNPFRGQPQERNIIDGLASCEPKREIVVR
jgi:hypothetical protein